MYQAVLQVSFERIAIRCQGIISRFGTANISTKAKTIPNTSFLSAFLIEYQTQPKVNFIFVFL